MKKTVTLALGLALLAGGCKPPGDSGATAGSSALDTDEQKTAYTLGYKLGQNLKPLQLPADEVAAVQQGLGDAASGGEAKVPVAEYEAKVAALATKRASQVAEERRGQEEAYLAKAKAEEGAQEYDSGLIMVPETEGTGASPSATDQVKVHYHGTFSNGDVFDSSVQRGEPVTFPLNRVIPCWTEALQKMKVGGKAKITCPAKIAYGTSGAPPRIPPGATLVFEVELLDIVKPGGAG